MNCHSCGVFWQACGGGECGDAEVETLLGGRVRCVVISSCDWCGGPPCGGWSVGYVLTAQIIVACALELFDVVCGKASGLERIAFIQFTVQIAPGVGDDAPSSRNDRGSESYSMV